MQHDQDMHVEHKYDNSSPVWSSPNACPLPSLKEVYEGIEPSSIPCHHGQGCVLSVCTLPQALPTAMPACVTEQTRVHASTAVAGHEAWNISANPACTESTLPSSLTVSELAAQRISVERTHGPAKMVVTRPDKVCNDVSLPQLAEVQFDCPSADKVARSQAQSMQIAPLVQPCKNPRAIHLNEVSPVGGVPVLPVTQLQSSDAYPCNGAQEEQSNADTGSTSLLATPRASSEPSSMQTTRSQGLPPLHAFPRRGPATEFPAAPMPQAKRPRGRPRKRPLPDQPQVAVSGNQTPLSPCVQKVMLDQRQEPARISGCAQTPGKRTAAVNSPTLLEGEVDPCTHQKQMSPFSANQPKFHWTSLQHLAMDELDWSLDHFEQIANIIVKHGNMATGVPKFTCYGASVLDVLCFVVQHLTPVLTLVNTSQHDVCICMQLLQGM
jgi:hypothetical protein